MAKRTTLWTRDDIGKGDVAEKEVMRKPPERPASRAPARSEEEQQTARNSLIWQTVYPEYHQEAIEVTPTMAAVGLAAATPNRRVSAPRVDELGRAIENDWNFDGSPVRFDRNGGMFDGRHRLLACVKVNKPFYTCVVYGLPPEAMRTVDTNRVRTAGDQLGILNIPYAYQTAAAARWLLGIKQGIIGRQRLAREVTALAIKHETLPESVAMCYLAMGTAPSLISAIHYIGTHFLGLPDEADAFAAVFVNGTPAMENCPAKAWREHLLRLRNSRQFLTKEAQLYGTIHAWNKHVRKEPALKATTPTVATIDNFDVSLI